MTTDKRQIPIDHTGPRQRAWGAQAAHVPPGKDVSDLGHGEGGEPRVGAGFAGTTAPFWSAAWALTGEASARVCFFVTSFVALGCFGRKNPRGCILRSERRTIFKSCETARSGIGSPK